mgnify:CR=1 FL=1
MPESIEGKPGQPPEQEAGRQGEEYYRRAQQEQYAMTDPGHEALKLGTGETAGIVVKVASDLLEDFEDLDKKDREITSWTLARYYEQLASRRRAMKLTVEELDRFKIREPLVIEGVQIKDESENPILISRFPGYGIEIRDTTVRIPAGEEMVTDVEVTGFDEKGKPIEGEKKVRLRRTEQKVRLQVPDFGTDQERERIVEIYDRTERMMVVRQDLATLFGDIYLPNTASLENLVTLYHLGRNVPKFSNAELKTLFTLPDFNRVGERPEDRTLGNYIDLANRLFEIAAVSEFRGGNDEETQKRLKGAGLRGEGLTELAARPGWKDIVFEEMSEEEIKQWVGDWKEWVPDDQRHSKTIEDEHKAGNRGLLTEFGNTWARRGKNDEAVLLNRIEWFIVKDYMRRHNADIKTARQIARTAVRLAYYFDKVSGFFAYLGKERYLKISVKEDGKQVVKDALEFPRDPEELKSLLNDKDRLKSLREALLLEGDPKTDDLTKLYHFKEYRMKEFLKQRTAGPGVTIPDSEERIALPLILLARSKTPQGWRSFHEQRWGYAAKGNQGKQGYMPEEPAKRLGNIDWDITLSVDELQEQLGVRLDPKDIEEMLRVTSRELNKITGKGPDEVSTDTEGLQNLDVWNLYTLFNWLAGRDDEIKGLYKFYYAEDFDPRLFGNDAFWKGKNKFLEIVINLFVKSDGQYRHLYEDLRKQYPGQPIEDLDDKLQGVLTELTDESYDKNRELFVLGMANLPNTQVWRGTTVETRGATGTTKMPSTYWRLARETAQNAGYPFPEEYY